MAGGALWTKAEDAFIQECIRRGCSNQELIEQFQLRFGAESRTPPSLRRRRSIVSPSNLTVAPDIYQREAPSEEDEQVQIDIEEGADDGYVYVLASSSIKNPEELFEASRLDPEVWELCPGDHPVKKWDVPMKLKTKGGEQQAVVVPCYYISIKVRRNWRHSDIPTPVFFKLPPAPKKLIAKRDTLTSVHFSDIHFPHHDQRAVDILYAVMSDLPDIDVVVDQGDTLDCHEISAYPKNPNARISLGIEIQQGAEHFATIAQLTPNARRIWCEGNHEDRLRRLIWSLSDKRQAGEILTLEAVREALEWGNLLGLGSLDFEVLPYPSHELLWDKLVVCHGETARQGSGQSEKAELAKYSKSGISGHTHRIGGYTQRIYDGSLSWWGLGCLCSLQTQSYINHPNWQQGFAIVNWSRDKNTYSVERVRIHDGRAIFRGRTYGSP